MPEETLAKRGLAVLDQTPEADLKGELRPAPSASLEAGAREALSSGGAVPGGWFALLSRCAPGSAEPPCGLEALMPDEDGEANAARLARLDAALAVRAAPGPPAGALEQQARALATRKIWTKLVLASHDPKTRGEVGFAELAEAKGVGR